MDSDLSSNLESVVSRLEKKKNLNQIVDENNSYDYYSSRLLSTSPAEAIYGDSPGDRTEDMAIEDACELNWDEDANITAPTNNGLGVIPMPPPTSYNDANVPTRPESPNFNSDLEHLFNPDPNSDVLEATLPGVCGLYNLGNTCFMNSGLQCLLNTPPLVHLFMSHAKESLTAETLATHFANLLQKIWSGKYSKVKPIEFQLALANQHPQFKDYRQHDCQEFLALLLNSLHELLNTASGKSHVSDLSADPMTPRSVCEESAAVTTDAVETDSTSQMALSLGGRCEASSSSSRSSESSIGASQIRLRPLPDDVLPFKSVQPASLWEAMDSISETCDTLSTGEVTQDSQSVMMDESNSNLLAQRFLKRDAKMVNVAAAGLNNVQPCLYKDIFKDAKTSNVNVLVVESTVNNEIVFDSEKFPKHENTRRRDTCENPNLTEFHNFEGKTVNVKRIKETNKFHSHADVVSDYCSLETSSDFYNCHTKRFKLEENLTKEKNVRMEFERHFGDDDKSLDDDGGEFSGAVALACASAAAILDDDLEADKQWEKHLGLNQSVIVDSFQGQFKSTVVCSECRHVSSTYEPFMYLSVPLPHAMEQQLCVTFVPASATPPTKFLLTLNRQDKVVSIKQQLRTLMEVNDSMSLELAEVLEHHIARILDENHLIRYISTSDPNRSIYAFEISEDVVCTAGIGDVSCDAFCPEPLDLTPEPINAFEKTVQLNNLDTPCRKQDSEGKISSFTNNLQSMSASCRLEAGCAGSDDSEAGKICEKTEDPKSCAICLEEMDKQLKNHKGCSCFLCDNCIECSIKHFNDGTGSGPVESPGSGLMRCPVCSVTVSPSIDFVDADDASELRTSIRVLKVPVLFRQDQEDGGGLDRDERLIGHPHLIKVANRLPGSLLYKIVGKLVPYHSNYSIVFVDGQGYHCSRCLYNARCKGCLVPTDAEVTLQSGDNLAVRFTLPVVETTAIYHPSLRNLREQDQLSLYDCLDAFCESETLDEHNPWYCPTCERNRCATKTLSVWRYPDFLIVYLKRFVFHEYTGVKLDNKVSFPLVDLALKSPSSSHPDLTRRYDLYACVNHLGGASAGHYTAYAKNPNTGNWHLFNDDTVTAQKPQENDFNHAYILFYQKQGVQPASNMLSSFLGGRTMKENMDQLLINLEPENMNTRLSQKDVMPV